MSGLPELRIEFSKVMGYKVNMQTINIAFIHWLLTIRKFKNIPFIIELMLKYLEINPTKMSKTSGLKTTKY